MAEKYHINTEKGTVGRCYARIRCRFGGPQAHYPSEMDARSAFEREMEREQYSLQINSPKPVSNLPDGYIVEENGRKVGKLPAGEYFLGDPFIIIGTYDQEGWNSYTETVDSDMGWENDVEDPSQEKEPIVGAMYDGVPVVSVKAYHGSGLHWSTEPPRRIPSDAGLISAIPIKILNDLGVSGDVARQKRLGFVHQFDSDIKVYREDNGNIHFGEIMVVVHDDTIPDRARVALNKYDNEGTNYEPNPERTALRKKTYDKVVNEFLDIEV